MLEWPLVRALQHVTRSSFCSASLQLPLSQRIYNSLKIYANQTNHPIANLLPSASYILRQWITCEDQFDFIAAIFVRPIDLRVPRRHSHSPYIDPLADYQYLEDDNPWAEMEDTDSGTQPEYLHRDDDIAIQQDGKPSAVDCLRRNTAEDGLTSPVSSNCEFEQNNEIPHSSYSPFQDQGITNVTPPRPQNPIRASRRTHLSSNFSREQSFAPSSTNTISRNSTSSSSTRTASRRKCKSPVSRTIGKTSRKRFPVCEDCGQRFNRPNDLKRHQETACIHGRRRLVRITCPVAWCQKTLTRKDAVSRHLQTEHGRDKRAANEAAERAATDAAAESASATLSS